uniref:Small ribosomal subunit protein uS3c n=1 Tax=Chlorotetraedron incus TaxID=162317 RepID=A0A140HAA3_9CHLO|nr:ribosomal protein S3 [Chlorotetraedron incus]AMO01102.1 ribosomal protein S3 [Chlorotetraedron incus]
MGQKIHPLGFRVGITKKHQNQWFARFHKHQYAQTLLEDRLLRQTLLKLLPEILQKKADRSQTEPKISHIKIERGFIPYEIGIQIHAQNCDMVKSAIEKLEVQPHLIHNLLKNQVILEKAALKAKEMNYLRSSTKTAEMNDKKNTAKKVSKTKVNDGKKALVSKRLQKRKTALKLFQERFLKNVFVLKKGKKITRKFKKTVFNKTKKSSFRKQGMKNFRNRFSTNFSSNTKYFGKNQKSNRFGSNNNKKNNLSLVSKKKDMFAIVKKYGAVQSNKMTRFVDLFVAQTNRQFINQLKTEMNYWNKFLNNYKEEQMKQYGSLKFAPIGYDKKWSLVRLERIKKQPLNLLIKLVKSLQKQALKKLENLRQEFLVLGTLSKAKSFAYFQRIRFIKSLRNYIQQVNAQLKKQRFQQLSVEPNRQTLKKQEKALLALSEKALKRKLSNLKNEHSKMKFIDYLQETVKQHRNKNLFLYLATISDSRKYLRKIRNFTKQQANFLFGVNLNSLSQLSDERRRDVVKNQILKTMKQINRKNELQKTFHEVFFEQLQKQKTMCKQNIELTPKISFKFYSVKPQNLETKASFVADCIVDDLEKRKAFRRVIKKAKEDLMKTSKVKGVKIQVSGRLNGAEIARSEWVRSGRVPLQTLRANIDYCYKTAQTIYGIIGVKIWIYKGYTKNTKKTLLTK